MGLFGPSRGEVWQQLSDAIGATYTPGGFFKGDRVDARVDDWIVTLDTFTESDGKTSTTYTRLRAPFRNPSGVRFSIHRSGIFSGIGRALGFQDIATGDEIFDEAFVLTGNSLSAIVDVFQDPQIRELLQYQPSVHFEIRDNEGWFGSGFPADTDELYFRAYGTIKDIDQLRALFDLFSAVLHRLTQIGAAVGGDAGVYL